MVLGKTGSCFFGFNGYSEVHPQKALQTLLEQCPRAEDMWV